MPEFESKLVEIGFTQWEPNDPHTYESGWYPGQTDTPEEVMAAIREHDEECEVVFLLNGSGQFDIRWSAYTRNPDSDDE